MGKKNSRTKGNKKKKGGGRKKGETSRGVPPEDNTVAALGVVVEDDVPAVTLGEDGDSDAEASEADDNAEVTAEGPPSLEASSTDCAQIQSYEQPRIPVEFFHGGSFLLDKGVFHYEEKFDFTLDQWRDPIIDHNGDFTADFKQIFLDIVKGIQYLHFMVGIVHGELTANNIYVKRSRVDEEKTFLYDKRCFDSDCRAKIGTPVPEGFVVDPRIDFRSIKKLLEHMVTSTVLEQLNESARMDYDGFLFILNNLNSLDLNFLHMHPFLLDCIQRCALRHIAYHNTVFHGTYYQVLADIRLEIAKKPHLNCPNWKQAIASPRLQKLDSYTSCGNDAVGFFNFSRIALVHGNEESYTEPELRSLSIMEMDSLLSRAWPSMMSIWFQIIKNRLGKLLFITMPGPWSSTYQL